MPYVDEQFTQESKKEIVTNKNFTHMVDFDGAAWVKVYNVTTSKMNDYNRDGVDDGNWSFFGEVKSLDATTQEFKLDKDRSFTFVLDKLDTNETNNALNAAEALARQNREVVIPEVDEYVFNKICENAGHKPEPVALTAENIYTEIIKATEALDEAFVPDVNRVLVVTPKVYRLMKQCKDITLNTEVGKDMLVKGVIANLDGMEVQRVASSTLPENFGFLVVHKSATIAPVKLQSYRTHEDPPGISGFLVEGRVVYGAFVMDNKKCAIYYQEMAAE